MRVGVRGEYSEWMAVTSGVSQGSVLGPIMFLMYVYDRPDGVKCLIKLCVDDAKLLKKITDEYDRYDHLCVCSGMWQLTFNVPKCNQKSEIRNLFI